MLGFLSPNHNGLAAVTLFFVITFFLSDAGLDYQIQPALVKRA
jgi:hypothetical protein